MALPVWCELTCDQCNCTLVGQWHAGPYLPHEALVTEAESTGAVVQDNVIFCAECAEKRAKEQPHDR